MEQANNWNISLESIRIPLIMLTVFTAIAIISWGIDRVGFYSYCSCRNRRTPSIQSWMMWMGLMDSYDTGSTPLLTFSYLYYQAIHLFQTLRQHFYGL